MLVDESHQPLMLTSEVRKLLRRFARDHGLEPHDLLLLGDGSGTTHREPAGWACIAYDLALKQAVVHAGGLTAGTNNFAELMPFVHALWFHTRQHKDKITPGCKVAVVSDSEVTVRCGNRLYSRQANGFLWAGVEWFEQHGYDIKWHHVLRVTDIWNEFSDALAGQSRLAMIKLNQVAHDLGDRILPMDASSP
jgi:ribonuclease HI